MENSAITQTSKAGKIPSALWALTISAFGIGTTELVIVGLLPTIARDLNTSISYTGLLVTLYAMGVALGGPILTALTGKIARKKLLLGVMILFITGHVLAALAPGFFVLVLARILSGFAHGVFFAVGATIAGSLVSADKRATAISIMFAGLTLAMVTGVPLGTFIGQHFGWRATFAGVALLGVIGFIANFLLLPPDIPMGQPLKLKDQFKVLQNGPILLVLAITALAFAGTFTAFTYLAVLLGKLSNFSENEITILLLIYGIAIALGNIIGGRAANKKPIKALTIMFLLQAVVLIVLTFAIPYKTTTSITLFFMGILAFSNVPGLQLYIVQLAEKYLPGTQDVASALNIAAFNVGIAVGAYVGGIVIDSSLGVGATPWIGAIFVGIGLILSFVSWRNKE
ncbi:MFS transporter [Mucilaginibacter sp. NFX135]|uniref:MFS transporter n=1 Tax=Mucilaginibacter sp. NFX135 TaxID=3402687 RepID=UPI003AFAC9A6